MSTFEGAVPGIRANKLSSTSVTDIVAETNRCLVKKVFATEIASSTATLTLEVYDGTTSYYFVKAKAMTALQTLVFEVDFLLNPGWKLRATAGTADKIDIIAVLAEPSPA
jgi:hypothetical protein